MTAEQSVEAIDDDLYRRGVTDGIPTIPPTRERIEEMLRGTDLDPDHELAVLGEGALTVETLAAHAVLAGCLPPQMPVLVAAARAMADERANVDRAVAGPDSYAFQWLVNGPIRDRLDIRSDTGAFGPGFRVNRSMGRALGLAYDNTAAIDRQAAEGLGSPFAYTIFGGENEAASPWEPYHVSAGYAAEDNTITFSARRSFLQFIPYEMSADGILQAMLANLTPALRGRSRPDHDETVVYTLGPYNAEELADAGLSKRDVQEYLCDNSVASYDTIAPPEDDPVDAGWAGKARPLQAPRIAEPDLVQLYVVGGSGRFNAVGGTIGGPVTEAIELPAGWDALVDEYGIDREWGTIAQSYDDIDR